MEVVTTLWVTDNNVVSTDFFQNLWASFTSESTCIFKVAVLSSNFKVWTFSSSKNSCQINCRSCDTCFNKVWWRKFDATASTNAFASSGFLFIFQLPAINGLRDISHTSFFILFHYYSIIFIKELANFTLIFKSFQATNLPQIHGIEEISRSLNLFGIVRFSLCSFGFYLGNRLNAFMAPVS